MSPHFVLMKIARDERTDVFRARTIYHVCPWIARARGHIFPKPAKNRQKRTSAGCLCAVLRPGVRLRQPEQRTEKEKQRRRGGTAAIQPRQYHAGRGQNNAGEQSSQTQAEQRPDERVHPGRAAPRLFSCMCRCSMCALLSGSFLRIPKVPQYTKYYTLFVPVVQP